MIQSSSMISNGKVIVSRSTSISSLVFQNGVLNTGDNLVAFQNFSDILFKDLQIIGRMRFENIEKIMFSNVKFFQEISEASDDTLYAAPRLEFINFKLSGTL